MKHYQFVQNRDCEFFPCHSNVQEENFNCIFCYCPLYALGNRCGGAYHYTECGIKDCSSCIRPHVRENYAEIVNSVNEVIELARRGNKAP